MRVSQTRRSNVTERRRPARGAGAGNAGFQLPADTPPARRREMAAPQSVGNVDTIVALQLAAGPPDQRKQAVETGGSILDLLDQLKIGLLSGGVREGDLAALSKAVARQQNLPDDPNLNEVLKEIDLRARVELAKLKRDAA